MNLYVAVGNPEPPTDRVMFSFDLEKMNPLKYTYLYNGDRQARQS
jgi:hypothetical protein